MTDKEKFLDFIKVQKGKPYKLGEEGSDEYDCSGLIYAGLKQLTSGEIPRSSTDQYELGSAVGVENAGEGDLIFFDTGWTSRKPNHNGVCIGGGKMINANSYYNSVTEESYHQDYWQDKIYGNVRRIFKNDGSLSLSGSVSTGHTFSDVPATHKYYFFIEEMYQKGVVNGYPDGNFKPESNINRVEALKIILKALGISVSGTFDPLIFSDTDDSQWYAKYVAAAIKEGIVHGYPDNTFRPASNINRAEMCKIIFKSGGIEPNLPSASSYEDVKIDSWYARYVLKAVEWDMFEPASSLNFSPESIVKRGEMCKAIVKFLDNK